jgi:hypothetical protein
MISLPIEPSGLVNFAPMSRKRTFFLSSRPRDRLVHLLDLLRASVFGFSSRGKMPEQQDLRRGQLLAERLHDGRDALRDVVGLMSLKPEIIRADHEHEPPWG